MARFTRAISEGDGISVIPVLSGDVASLAAVAERAGAEGVAVSGPRDAELARAATDLPVLVRGDDPAAASRAGADAWILLYDPPSGEGDLIEEQHALARELGLDCAVDVRDEHSLEQVLELVDPDIILISGRDPADAEAELERTLDLLPDVPAGKLVISESSVFAREQLLALERVGIDAVLVDHGDGDFEQLLAELTGRSG